MSPSQAPQKCHNCRRRRLVCDRTLPACRKCATVGQDCLGYGKLFIWANAVATRGKRAGQTSFAPTFESPVSSPSSSNAQVLSRPGSAGRSLSPEAWEQGHGSLKLYCLLDPVVQDFDASTRHYLNYYVDRVTLDLVVHDIPDRNPFRNVVPLCQKHDFLRHIVVAVAAVHQVSLLRSRGLPIRARLLDALTAKHKAIVLIKEAIEQLGPHNYTDLLIAVVFLVNFELVDSGRDSWKAHIGAAGRLMALLQPSAAAAASAATATATATTAAWRAADSHLDALRDYIMSDCLTFFILGSTLSPWDETGAAEVFGSIDVVSTLLRAESNTYHSCPSEILSTILRATQLASEMHRTGGGSGGHVSPSSVQKEAAVGLMQQLRAFDARRWAERIIAAGGHGGRADDGDGGGDDPEVSEMVRSREHMACAHRSAACVYLLMAAPEAFVDDARESARTAMAEGPASDIFEHLSYIGETDMLFKGSVWPTFILGAHAADPALRAWVIRRLEKMWLSICPWGYVKTALETLRALWTFRDGEQASFSFGVPCMPEKASRWGWLSELRALNVDCLIV